MTLSALFLTMAKRRVFITDPKFPENGKVKKNPKIFFNTNGAIKKLRETGDIPGQG